MIFKIIFGLVFFIGLIYLLIPSWESIHQFPALPDSLQSQDAGDTWQNPNNKAYYSNFRREFVTNFYQAAFSISWLGIKIPSLKLNHPPETAYTYVRDQQRCSYLEEFVYPMRDSFFVCGWEPIGVDGKRFDGASVPIEIGDQLFESKSTLRLYPSRPIWRVMIYLLVWGLVWLLVKAIVGIIRDNRQ